MKKAIWVVSAMMFCAVLGRAEIFTIGLNSTNLDLSTGTLAGTNEVPLNHSLALGGEVGDGISYDNSTMTLTVNVAYGLFGFPALQGTLTGAYIQQGAVGVNGPIVINLGSGFRVTSRSGFWQEATFTLTPALETALFNDLLYMNLTTSAFTGGEIRAQLIPTTVPEPATEALIGLGLAALLVFRRKNS